MSPDFGKMNQDVGKTKRIANILVVVLFVLVIIIAIAIAQRQPKAQLPVHDANGITHGAVSTPEDIRQQKIEPRHLSQAELDCLWLYRKTYNEKQSDFTLKQLHDIDVCQLLGFYHDIE